MKLQNNRRSRGKFHNAPVIFISSSYKNMRILQTIAMNEGLNMIVGDIGNAFVPAYTEEKIWSRAGSEFGDKEGSVIILNNYMD